MADAFEKMVLRTLYLPLETDRQLKALAFTRDVSKGELMRELIKQGLVAIAASGERSLSEQLSARLAPVQTAPLAKKAVAASKPVTRQKTIGTRPAAGRKRRELASAG